MFNSIVITGFDAKYKCDVRIYLRSDAIVKLKKLGSKGKCQVLEPSRFCLKDIK